MALVQKQFGDLITFTRASGGGRFNSAGNFEWLAANQPRFDYDPVTKLARGLLIEESRTNLLLWSEQFDSSYWLKQGTIAPPVVSADVAISPDGTTSADSISFQAAVNGDTSSILRNTGLTTVAGQPYTFGFWVKAKNPADVGKILVSRHVAGSAYTSIVLTADWKRVSWTEVAFGTNGSFSIGLNPSFGSSTGTIECLIWGIQLESGAFTTSYIPTTTTQVTRAVDVSAVNTLSPWYNSAAGTLLYSGDLVGGSPVLVQLGDGTINNIIRLSISGGNVFADVITGGVSQASLNLGVAPAAGTVFKAALAFANNDFAGCLNGGTVQTDTSGTIPSGLTTLRIGGNISGVTGAQHVRLDKHYPRRLSNAELQQVTS